MRPLRAKSAVAMKSRRRRYTLDELLAQCDRKARRGRKEREWLRGRRVGGELI
jgi:antitoxin ChpS